MKFKFERILASISGEDLRSFYFSIYDGCEYNGRRDLESHLLGYLRFYLRERRASYVTSEDLILEMTIKAMKILSFLEYMEIKYNLKQGE